MYNMCIYIYTIYIYIYVYTIIYIYIYNIYIQYTYIQYIYIIYIYNIYIQYIYIQNIYIYNIYIHTLYTIYIDLRISHQFPGSHDFFFLPISGAFCETHSQTWHLRGAEGHSTTLRNSMGILMGISCG